MRESTALLLLSLAGVTGLWLYSRTKGGAQLASDALEGIVVTVDRITGAWLAKVPPDLKPAFAVASAQQHLPANLLEAVAYRESRFRGDIISGETRSSAGAVGIMQIIPRFHPSLGEAGALDPQRAIPYAAKYLRQLYNQFADWRLALAAYNWGPGNLAGARDEPESWPKETRAYVAEIAANAGLPT